MHTYLLRRQKLSWTLFFCGLASFAFLAGCASSARRAEKPGLIELTHGFPEEEREELESSLRNREEKIQKLQLQIEKLAEQLASREVLQAEPVVEAVPPPSPPPKKVTEEITEPLEQTVADSSDELMHWYFNGVRQIEDKEYVKAVRSFSNFLKIEPTHIYADRARFLLAESHLRNGEYTLVLAKTNSFEEEHPYSFKLGAVLFQRGVSFSELGHLEQAGEAFRSLVNRFPHSSLATQATERLARLNSASTSTP